MISKLKKKKKTLFLHFKRFFVLFSFAIIIIIIKTIETIFKKEKEGS
jgi:hypothetical protein